MKYVLACRQADPRVWAGLEDGSVTIQSARAAPTTGGGGGGAGVSGGDAVPTWARDADLSAAQLAEAYGRLVGAALCASCARRDDATLPLPMCHALLKVSI